MAGLLPPGLLTFLDSNGDPLVGGTVRYEDPASPGTLKSIWIDQAQTTVAQNPVPLNASGRPFSGGSEVGIYGTGQYLMQVYSVAGVLQWSALTQQDLSLSDLTALQTSIANETSARIAADNTETAARIAGDNAVNQAVLNEATARNNEDVLLSNQIAAETTRAQAAEAALQANLGQPAHTGDVRAGTVTTDGVGNFSVTFSPAFPTKCVSIQVVDRNPTEGTNGYATDFLRILGFPGSSGPGNLTPASATAAVAQARPTGVSSLLGPVTIDWIAFGY